MSWLKRIFWPVVGLTLIVYCIMVVWSLPTIAAYAGGLIPFDMRPLGYTFDEARAFLAALPPDGAEFYRNVQHSLDVVYPALLAFVLFAAIALLLPSRFGWWRYVVALIAIPGMVFDYLENAAVAGMLATGAAALTPAIVQRASAFTLAKSGLTTLAMLLVLALVARSLVRRWRGWEAA